MQSVRASLPTGDVAFGVHQVQISCPFESANVPASHGKQLVDPFAVVYVPVSHGKQLVEPLESAYVPASHSLHHAFSEV